MAVVQGMKSLEAYFELFKKHIIGDEVTFQSIHGPKKLLYADWIASGRLYAPIEAVMKDKIGPMVANTHSFSSETGKATTYTYRHARALIKQHLNANADDVLVTAGTGMTGVLSRLLGVMGLRHPEAKKLKAVMPEAQRPVVFISQMEHHSNHVPWMETLAEVVMVPCNDHQMVCTQQLEALLEKYQNREFKIGAFTACSNVTGMVTPYHQLAKIMHSYGGKCVVDFAASAPYVNIDMHPADPEQQLDAILFSPHKFLGGPGSCGVLVFHKTLYRNSVPEVPGGGSVKWTNPWGGYAYFEDLETREDAGTPGFLQTIRAALSIRLKEQMGVTAMAERESQLLKICFTELQKINGLCILGDINAKRIGCVSFTVKGIHYNLIVRLLNDRFGIQVRGGWSCASTYGHQLLHIDANQSQRLIEGIEQKDLSKKPGWVRLSIHPTMSNAELLYSCDAIAQVVHKIGHWQKDYIYNPKTNEFDALHHDDAALLRQVKSWFNPI